MDARITCPRYGCGVIQSVAAATGLACPNCGEPLPAPPETGRDRRSVGLLAAMTLIAGLTWYVAQRAI